MTVRNLLQDQRYKQKIILEKLVCHITWFSKKQLFINTDHTLSEKQIARIHQGYTTYMIEKQPLEYILWYVTFLGVDFSVTSATLIPRPETEYMIQAVNEHLANKTHVSLLDIWTWCGVLGLSTLYHNPGKITQAYLTDMSSEALHVATQNYTQLSLDRQETPVEFLESNLLDHTKIHTTLHTLQETLLVANLPYIPDQLFDENTDETIQKREPRMAFVWWDDGLDLYRIMFDQLIDIQHTNTQSWNVTMFLEMMTRQVDILRQAYKNIFTLEEVKTFHFNIRIVKAIFV